MQIFPVCLTLAAAATFLSISAVSGQSGLIQGSVTDLQNRPVSGATVTLNSDTLMPLTPDRPPAPVSTSNCGPPFRSKST